MNWLDPNATNPLLLFAVFCWCMAALAGVFAAVLGVVLAVGWAWRGVRWLYRRYRARREQKRLDAATDALIRYGMHSADRFGLLTKDFK